MLDDEALQITKDSFEWLEGVDENTQAPRLVRRLHGAEGGTHAQGD